MHPDGKRACVLNVDSIFAVVIGTGGENMRQSLSCNVNSIDRLAARHLMSCNVYVLSMYVCGALSQAEHKKCRITRHYTNKRVPKLEGLEAAKG